MHALKRLAPAILLAAAACAHVPAPNSFKAEPEAIEADGAADFNVKDLAASKAGAVMDAERAAVRRAAELFLDDASRAGGADALDPVLLKSPQNYVSRYKTLAEGQDGAYYRVTLRVWVRHDKVASALRGLDLSGAASSRRALLAQAGAADAQFSAAFRNAFAKRSQITVDALKAPASGPGEAVRAAGVEGADLVFWVSASASSAGDGTATGFYPSRGEAALTVYDAADGRELLRLSGQANAVDSSADASRAKALSAAAEMLAQEAAVKTARLLKSDPSMRVTVMGLSGLDAAGKVKAELQALDLKALRLESYSSGTAVFEVVPRTQDPQEFVSAVLRGDSLGLELEGVEAHEAAFAVPR